MVSFLSLIFFQYELKIWQIWRLHEWCHQSNTVWQCSAYMLVMKTGFFNVDRHAFFMYFVWRTRRWYSDIFSMFCVYNGLLQKVIKVDRDIFLAALPSQTNLQTKFETKDEFSEKWCVLMFFFFLHLGNFLIVS